MNDFWRGFEKRAEEDAKESLLNKVDKKMIEWADKGYLYSAPFIGPVLGGYYTGRAAPEGSRFVSGLSGAAGTAGAVEIGNQLSTKLIRKALELSNYAPKGKWENFGLMLARTLPGAFASHYIGKHIHEVSKE